MRATKNTTILNAFYRWYASKQQLKEEGKRTDSMVQHDFPEDEIGVRFWKRFCRMCREVPVWDNFYLAWWLRGGRGFEPDNTDSKAATAPPCLTRSGFSQLKVRKEGIKERKMYLCFVESCGSSGHSHRISSRLSDTERPSSIQQSK